MSHIKACKIQWIIYLTRCLSFFKSAFHFSWCCLENSCSKLQADLKTLNRKRPCCCCRSDFYPGWTHALCKKQEQTTRCLIHRQELAVGRSGCNLAFVALYHTPSMWISRGGSYSALIQEFFLSSRTVARSLVSTLEQTFSFMRGLFFFFFSLSWEKGVSAVMFSPECGRFSSLMFRFKVQRWVLQKESLFFFVNLKR